MRGPFHRRFALCLLLSVCPVFAASGASILTSNNPGVSLSTRLQEERRVDLSVESTPSGAEVSINGRPRGLTPLRLSNLSPGISVIEVAASGHQTTEVRVRFQGGEVVTLGVPLRRETGRLRVDVQPEDAELFLSGTRHEPEAPIVLPTGEYIVEVRRFGYRDTEVPIAIAPGGVTSLGVALEPAPFVVEIQETADRGGVALRATAPGSADIILRDSEGRELFRRRIPLEAPETRILPAEEVPPGDYRLTVRAEDSAGETVQVLSRRLTVPETPDAFVGLRSGAPGLLYAPLPKATPPGTTAVGTGWAYVPDPQGIDAPASTFSLAASVDIREEIRFFFGARALLMETQERNRLSFSVGALRQLWETGEAALALGARVSFDAPLGSEKEYRPDFFGTPEGAYLFLPASVEVGPVLLAAAPEAGYSWRPPRWTTGEQEQTEPAGIFGVQAGAGIHLGPLFVGASGRLSWSAGGNPGNAEPTTQVGTEARLRVPQWGTAIGPFFALAGPWSDLSGIFGLSVTVSRY